MSRMALASPQAMADLKLLKRAPFMIYRPHRAAYLAPATQAEDAHIARLQQLGVVERTPLHGFNFREGSMARITLTSLGAIMLRRLEAGVE